MTDHQWFLPSLLFVLTLVAFIPLCVKTVRNLVYDAWRDNIRNRVAFCLITLTPFVATLPIVLRSTVKPTLCVLFVVAVVSIHTVVLIVLWKKSKRHAYGVTPSTVRRLVVPVVLASTIGPAMIALSSIAGGEAARESRMRLETIWPNVMSWQVRDRAIVVSLAIRCELNREPVNEERIVACLTRGVREDSERRDLNRLLAVRPLEPTRSLAPSRGNTN